MKLVIQRVNSASVTVNNTTVGKINKGMLILLGISKDYNRQKLDWMINKILALRLWNDENNENKGFQKNIEEIQGEILLVSQFTLFGDCTQGTKPKFNNSMEAKMAKEIYDLFIEKLKEKTNLNIQTGQFQAIMQVESVNDGPVTIILEK
jgi:D-tyrosyl-tRNA(Tyr) deacylase